MKMCRVEGCGGKVQALGWCMKHYVRMRRTGKLTTIRRMGSFWEKVKKGAEDECWPWQGFTKSSGHGLTFYKGHPMHTSRKAWMLTHGPIPDDLCVNHRCDNAICCNPAHMYLGTRSDNAIDQWAKLPPHERGRGVRSCMLSDEQLAHLWQLRKNGATLEECARHFGVHIQTVMRYITIARRLRIEKLRRDRLSERKSA